MSFTNKTNISNIGYGLTRLVTWTVAVLLILSLSTNTAKSAGAWYVAPGGSDSNDCLAPASPCETIQAAVVKASSGDIIYVAAGTYTGGNEEVVLIDKSINLSGGWEGNFSTHIGYSIVDGQNSRRGITDQEDISVHLERFTVQNGFASNGGGIYNLGKLTLENSTVTKNVANASYGGGIYTSGSITLTHATLSENIAPSAGGGLFAEGGTVFIDKSTLEKNSIGQDGASGGSGGAGFYLNFGNGIIKNSAIVNNQIHGSFQGNGICNYYSNLVVENSTISDNKGLSAGIDSLGGTLELYSVTITGNGEVGLRSAATSLSMLNTIFANQTTDIYFSPWYQPGVPVNDSYNLIGTLFGFTPSSNDLIAIPANLYPLAGSPAYRPLKVSSPAIDAANPAGCLDHSGNPLNSDQRNVLRYGRCDIGAYEVQPLEYSQKQVDRSNIYLNGTVTYTVTLNNPGDTEIPAVGMTDDLPDQLSYVSGSLIASKGIPTYQNGIISWNGMLGVKELVEISYSVVPNATAQFRQPITNTAVISSSNEIFSRSSQVQVDYYKAFGPLINYPCVPLYSDDFRDPTSGWPVSDTVNSQVQYTNGEYRLLVRPKYYGSGVRPGFQATDYAVDVDVRNPNRIGGSYGIAFGINQDWSAFYTLEIYPNGWFGIYSYGPTDYHVLAEAYSPAIHQGSATNHLKITRNGQLIRAFVNGQDVGYSYDNQFMGSLYVGIVVFSYNQPNVDIFFDNFSVHPLTCTYVLPTANAKGESRAMSVKSPPLLKFIEKSHSRQPK